MANIVGGKLTTCRRMTEATADLVCESLDLDADCATAAQTLPYVGDPDRLDVLVAEFDGQGPTDQDVVGTAPTTCG